MSSKRTGQPSWPLNWYRDDTDAEGRAGSTTQVGTPAHRCSLSLSGRRLKGSRSSRGSGPPTGRCMVRRWATLCPNCAKHRDFTTLRFGTELAFHGPLCCRHGGLGSTLVPLGTTLARHLESFVSIVERDVERVLPSYWLLGRPPTSLTGYAAGCLSAAAQTCEPRPHHGLHQYLPTV